MQNSHTQAGFVLIPVMLVLALLMALAVALHTSVTMDSGLNAGYNRATAGFYAAESGLDVAMNGFRNKFLLFQIPCSSTDSSCTDFSPTTYALGSRTVSYNLDDPGGNPKLVLVPAGHLFSGLNSVQYTYLVNSLSLNSSLTEASVGAEFNIQNIPLFQFLAFYSGDLEILPGANMTMHGRVHTNGELYLNSDASLTITTQPTPPPIPIVQVTSKGSIHRGRKDTAACGGTVQVMSSGTSPTLKTLSCTGSTSAVVPTPTLAAWNGSLVSGVNSISVPAPAVFCKDNSDACKYWQAADMRIALQLNGEGPHSLVVLNIDGTTNGTATTGMTGLLMQFINDAQFNQSKSDFKGTKPVFITDVPLAGTPRPGCSCNLNVYPPTNCPAQQLNCYWGTPMPTLTPTPTPRPPTPPLPSSTPTFTLPPASPTFTPTFGNNRSFYNLDRIYTTNTNLTLPTPGSPTPAAQAIGSMYKDSDPRRGGFYNWREKKWMYLLNVNLRDLLQWNIDYKVANGSYAFFNPATADPSNTDPSHTAKGGPVIYLTVIGPDSAGINNYGVRVFGSKVLPFPTPINAGDPTGITVVSDQAIYIAGDYNKPQTIGSIAYTKQPAAFMGDSINVLSNNGLVPTSSGNSCTNDCQSIASLDAASRGAVDSTINAAFIGGVDLTTSGRYNGGLENYIRFHESWSGDQLTYRGSFVSLGTPSHVNGWWCGTGGTSPPTPGPGNCNIYNPPTRAYDYDADFNDVKNLPPMTPRFVYVQQIVFTENFN